MKWSEVFIMQFDAALRTVFCNHDSERVSPLSSAEHRVLTASEISDAARKMRVNHTGEVCAQALYQAHALTARTTHVQQTMNHSAMEEIDHLAWCETRIEELNTHTSYLNPVWYAGSFMIGLLSGIAGDEWSLGFVAETEKQVVAHLQAHLESCSGNDTRTRVVLEQMIKDEGEHAISAMDSGGKPLPFPLPDFMRVCSRIMTTTAYYI